MFRRLTSSSRPEGIQTFAQRLVRERCPPQDPTRSFPTGRPLAARPDSPVWTHILRLALFELLHEAPTRPVVTKRALETLRFSTPKSSVHQRNPRRRPSRRSRLASRRPARFSSRPSGAASRRHRLPTRLAVYGRRRAHLFDQYDNGSCSWRLRRGGGGLVRLSAMPWPARPVSRWPDALARSAERSVRPDAAETATQSAGRRAHPRQRRLYIGDGTVRGAPDPAFGFRVASRPASASRSWPWTCSRRVRTPGPSVPGEARRRDEERIGGVFHRWIGSTIPTRIRF
jgi:hypothetical protein